ncbi:hypothetical protein BKA67DRAFT_542568 [Truncatella angustata]|uniref:Fungal N-terminal domain-containing protein n=1 Tax=Truncatella angustata TaxID=152316 RepID=A0A9P8REL3_9PEZI|nr:uncharacterized protein BKA67DRAFT_542568 [Truncatella angustata]KAH6640043.1 hypothetical protein BKA67DRAFT_542568 [Truncatella angustata]KAH8200517.1 hypothetical protein TruAng_005294 [Truncatella angustata]
MSGAIEIIGLVLAAPPVFAQIAKGVRNLYDRTAVARGKQILTDSITDFRRRLEYLARQFELGQRICANEKHDKEKRNELDHHFQAVQTILKDVDTRAAEAKSWSRFTRFREGTKLPQKLQELQQDLYRSIKEFTEIVRVLQDLQENPLSFDLEPDVFVKTTFGTTTVLVANVYLIAGNLAQRRFKKDPKQGLFVCERRAYDKNMEKDKRHKNSNIKTLAGKLTSKPLADGLLDFIGVYNNEEQECLNSCSICPKVSDSKILYETICNASQAFL